MYNSNFGINSMDFTLHDRTRKPVGDANVPQELRSCDHIPSTRFNRVPSFLLNQPLHDFDAMPRTANVGIMVWVFGFYFLNSRSKLPVPESRFSYCIVVFYRPDWLDSLNIFNWKTDPRIIT